LTWGLLENTNLLYFLTAWQKCLYVKQTWFKDLERTFGWAKRKVNEMSIDATSGNRSRRLNSSVINPVVPILDLSTALHWL
jgi:hypothetical protein